MALEYRVKWKREGLRSKNRIFAKRETAIKWVNFLSTPGVTHWRCDEGHGYYTPSWGVDRVWTYTCLPDIIEGPTVEIRQVSGWQPL